MYSTRMWVITKASITSLLLLEVLGNNFQCRDEDNKPVDWFVAYKLPRLKESSNPLIRLGTAYLYITPNTITKGWTLSAKSINDSKSFAGYTLQTLYDDNSNSKSDTLWLLYNDETPNKTVTFELGHTKGVVMSKKDGGFWLVHSVPRFPPVPVSDDRGLHTNHYSYPGSGTHFGQSFLCVSLAAEQMDTIGMQLIYNEPQIYSFNVPAAVGQTLPHLVAAINKVKVSVAPWFHQVPLTTLGGVQFQAFAKTSKFKKDLYADWVAPTLKVSLLVETWPNGPGRLPSQCSRPYKVNNVKAIGLGVANATFRSQLDHSKWGVASNSDEPWVCIGDINRAVTQEKRGGGTVCLRHPQVWTAYHQAVVGIVPCDSHPSPEYVIPGVGWLNDLFLRTVVKWFTN